MSTISAILWLISVTIAITIHEYAHAFAAEKLGDPTARLKGRLTLNPLKHYDPIGTTLLIVTALTGSIPFGWAKPVPFDPYNLQNPRKDGALIALAGPVSNLLLAIFLSLIVRFFLVELPLLNLILTQLITLNVALAIFNLVPIHPLDGGKIIYGLLPKELARDFNKIVGRYGMIILIFLILPMGGTSPLSAIITPIIKNLITILLP